MTGRLSTMQASLVVARRDFAAILFSRSFFFFLLGPLFPVLVGALAGGVSQRVEASASQADLAIAMSSADTAAMMRAHRELARWGQIDVPTMRVIAEPAPGEAFDARAALAKGGSGLGAVLTGTPSDPVLTGASDWVRAWKAPVALMAAQATGQGPSRYPEVAVRSVRQSQAKDRRVGLVTAQAAQTLLFLLTMLLAGMVLSNLVEEKGNKIIEILAAAVPMDAVFFGKLFAMLAVSLVGIALWALIGGVVALVAGSAIPDLPAPAVGWPLFLALGIVYFSLAYLLLGSVFLTIGSQAATVREVQTLNMPVTMLQLVVFFFASFAMTQPGSAAEIAAMVIPFSSPYAMIARAAQDPALWPQVAAIAWQGLCVVIFVRIGARLFRSRVMKSGPVGPRRGRRWFARKARAL